MTGLCARSTACSGDSGRASGRGFAACLLTAAALLAAQWQTTSLAQENPPDEAGASDRDIAAAVDKPTPRPPAWNGPPPGWQQPRFGKRVREEQVDLGYLLVDGQYVAPPYRIKLAAGKLTINDHLLDRPASVDGPQRGHALMNLFDRVAATLREGGVVLAFAEQPIVTLPNARERYDLFCQMLGRDGLKNVSWSDQLPTDFDRSMWDKWLRDSQPTAALQQRASVDLAEIDERTAAAEAEVAATRRLDRYSYPLTMLGMIGTVLGVGHLLSHRPPTGTMTPDIDATPDALRVVRWSLVLVIGLSALDLTWTILAYQAGQMRELNPFGSQLIDDPASLTLFKVGITGSAVALLFGLRRYRKAQLAAWWICLILTLLTARWLTLNSMFVSA